MDDRVAQLNASEVGQENSIDKIGASLTWALRPLIIWLTVGLIMLLWGLIDPEGIWAQLSVAIVPLGNLVATAWVLQISLRRDYKQLYLPIIPYLIAVAAYQSFGPLIFVFGSPADQAYASKHFTITIPVLHGVILLSQVCQLGVLTCYVFWRALFGHRILKTLRRTSASAPHLSSLYLGLALWGLAVKYLIQLPVDFHWVETKPPGLLIISGHLSFAAHFYFWNQVAQGALRRKLPLLLLAADVAFGVVMLAKTFMILPLLAMIFGWHLARPIRLRGWCILGLAGILGMGALQPLNAYLRIRRAKGEAASVVDLAGDLSELLTKENISELQDMKQTGDIDTSAHSRFSYVDSMAYGMHEYVQGHPGDSYKHFRYLLIPRMFWPTKPLAEPGLDFTRRVSGHELSYTGITLFGEAYFNAGWPGVLLLCVWLPILLLVAEIPARLVIVGGRMEHAFPLFLCMWVGMTVDSYAIFSVSSCIVAIGSIFFMNLLGRLVSTER